MNITTIILGLRIVGSLGLGIYLANLWKEGLRGLVIRCMPMKHRISESSYILQTRITTIVGMVFAVLIAIGINVGISVGLQRVGWAPAATTQSVIPKYIPMPPKRIPPTTKPMTNIPQPLPTPDPLSVFPAKKPVEKPVSTTSTPASEPVVRKEIVYVPIPAQKYQAIARPCYVQLYAFHTFEKARQQQARWIRQTPYTSRIGFVAQDLAPYKVLLGPFPSRQTAKQFQRQLTITSFIRSVEGVQVFE